MSFSQFLDSANPDHIFSCLIVGAIFFPLLYLFYALVFQGFFLILYRSKNKSTRLFAHRCLSKNGFWSAFKMENKCPKECKDCEFCDIKYCAGYIASHGLWRFRQENKKSVDK